MSPPTRSIGYHSDPVFGRRDVHLPPRGVAILSGFKGEGKSEVIRKGVHDDILAGRGVYVSDPTPEGDLTRQILLRTPPESLRRVVAAGPLPIRGRFVATNPLRRVLPPGDPFASSEAEAIVDNVFSAFEDRGDVRGVEWHRDGSNFLRALLRQEGEKTLRDFFRTVAHREGRSAFASGVEPGELRDLLVRAAAKDDHAYEPLARRLGTDFLANGVVRPLLTAQPSADFHRVVRERLVFLRWLPDWLGSEAVRIISTSDLRQLRYALSLRARGQESPEEFSIYLDEARIHRGSRLLPDLLAESRHLKASVTLALQSLHQLDEETRGAALAHHDYMVCFNPRNSKEAEELTKYLPGYGRDDLLSLGRFQAVWRLGGASPFTVRTYPPPPPLRAEIVSAVEESVLRYGAPVAPEALPGPSARPPPPSDIPAALATALETVRKRGAAPAEELVGEELKRSQLGRLLALGLGRSRVAPFGKVGGSSYWFYDPGRAVRVQRKGEDGEIRKEITGDHLCACFELARALRKTGATARVPTDPEEADVVAQVEGRTFLFEIENWPNRVEMKLQRFGQVREKRDPPFDALFIVVPSPAKPKLLERLPMPPWAELVDRADALERFQARAGKKPV
ncbi:MAG: hypothetical protein QXQ87_04640 [Halobacteria archaeon]